MAGINKATLVGNLGADPEIRSAEGGKKIASLRVATSESWKDKTTGEKKEKTEWHRVVIFNEPLAKFAEQYLKKGAKVYVEGTIRTRKWNDPKDGIDRWSTEIVLSGYSAVLQSLDRAPAGNRAPESKDAPTNDGPPARTAPQDLDDDIPF
jgi:single-strand DNA-binding protein